MEFEKDSGGRGDGLLKEEGEGSEEERRGGRGGSEWGMRKGVEGGNVGR